MSLSFFSLWPAAKKGCFIKFSNRSVISLLDNRQSPAKERKMLNLSFVTSEGQKNNRSPRWGFPANPSFPIACRMLCHWATRNVVGRQFYLSFVYCDEILQQEIQVISLGILPWWHIDLLHCQAILCKLPVALVYWGDFPAHRHLKITKEANYKEFWSICLGNIFGTDHSIA